MLNIPVFVLSVSVQGKRRGRGNWALFPGNKGFATAVRACVRVCAWLPVTLFKPSSWTHDPV